MVAGAKIRMRQGSGYVKEGQAFRSFSRSPPVSQARRSRRFCRRCVVAAGADLRGAAVAQAHRHSRRAPGHQPRLSQSARDRACLDGRRRTGRPESGDPGACAGARRRAAVGKKGHVEDRHAEKDHDHGLQAASGLKWHDGKPYTSKDFEFGWQIAKHPEFPMPDRLVPDLIAKIETPDDRTIVIHWNDLYNEAYAIQYTHVRAFPRHLLLDAFSAGDMKAFANLPFWN